MTEQEISEIYNTQCSKCKYRGVLGRERCCDYLTITGHSRGCSAAGCKRFEPGEATQRVKRIVIKPSTARKSRERRPLSKSKHMKPSSTYLGLILDGYMTAHDIPQRMLADLIGVHVSTIAGWRRGYKKVSKTSAEKIAKALNMDEGIIREAINKDVAEDAS